MIKGIEFVPFKILFSNFVSLPIREETEMHCRMIILPSGDFGAISADYGVFIFILLFIDWPVSDINVANLEI